jgi:hypothetical protein
MALTLTADDVKQSLAAHVAVKGEEIHAKYGPHIGWKELLLILEDRTCVRYPCEILFDAAKLYEGEMAHAVAKGEHPEEGFAIHVHPLFMTDLSRVPYVVLYQLVIVNYGEFASADDAEAFGAAVLGISRDEYYKVMCELADEVGTAELP